MDTANAVIELFLTEDDARARAVAEELGRLNQERQQTEEAITREMLEECRRVPVDGRFGLVFCGENWHRGVLGIVASRVVERFHRPVFVLGLDPADGMAQGSGRSIPGFHLLEALEGMPELFRRFGGHRHAAGVTLDGGQVADFRERFHDWAAARLTAEDLAAVGGHRRCGGIARDRRRQRGGGLCAGALRLRQPGALLRGAGRGGGRRSRN